MPLEASRDFPSVISHCDPSKHKTFVQHLYNVGPTSSTLVQHCAIVIQMFCVYWDRSDYPANTKHLYNICTMLDQRQRRWADIVQMLYKCFVFAG